MTRITICLLFFFSLLSCNDVLGPDESLSKEAITPLERVVKEEVSRQERAAEVVREDVKEPSSEPKQVVDASVEREPVLELLPERDGQVEEMIQPEPVVEKKPWLPTWSDNPCAKAPRPGYASTIGRWQELDKKSKPSPGGLVAVGSSSIRFWKRIQQDLSAWKVIQRGYGGSLLWDTAQYASKIIIPYQPRAVLVYAGTNDLTFGRSPDNVMLAYRCLVQNLQQGLGNVHIFFVGITPNPARWSNWSNAVKVNAGVKDLADTWAGLHYIDIPAAFLKTGQPPSANLFVADRLHLNDAGYALWTSVIKPVLSKAVPAQVYVTLAGQPASGSRVLVDLGPSNPDDGNPTQSPDTMGQTWNNWHSLEGGTSTLPGEALGLQTTTGKPTPWRLVLSGIFLSNGIKNGGLLKPDPAKLDKLAVATATQDYFYSQKGSGAQHLSITGLDPKKQYKLRLFASRNSSSETRVTKYTVVSLQGRDFKTLKTTGNNIGSDGSYDGNDNKILVFDNLKPEASGKLHLEVQADQGSFAYLSLLELTVR